MAYTITKEVFEILDEFEKAKNKAERKAVLLKYDCPALRDILRGTFDDALQFTLPEGKPPYTPNLPESVPSTLLKMHKTFGMFVRGGPGDELPRWKVEDKFINLLEAIHPQDSEIVLSMVAKQSPVKYLTKKLVEEAFPNLITR